MDNHTTRDFVLNTRRAPGSQTGKNPNALERPST